MFIFSFGIGEGILWLKIYKIGLNSKMLDGLFIFRFPKMLCRRFPSNLANLLKLDVVIKDGNAKVTANMRLLNSV